MFKITGLDTLQRQLENAQRALGELDGELGSFKFDPNDPASIEAAIQLANQAIDEKVGAYANNPIIGPVIEEFKQACRENILEKASAARLQKGE